MLGMAPGMRHNGSMRAHLIAAALPVLRRLEAERAHDIAAAALRSGWVGGPGAVADQRLAVEAMGIRFANPIGLAAGFDKDGRALPALARLGFGFLEVGSVTAAAQPGNPRPRLFRLPAERAVINRMGFNNGGIDALVERLRSARGSVPIGVNLGLNKGDGVPERDYPALVGAVAGLADYAVLNVSSPNTPRLRDLQTVQRLTNLLAAVANRRGGLPVLVKLAPDLADADLRDIVEAALDGGAAGLVLTNTTIARPAGLRGRHRAEVGGLSGRPLFAHSTAMLAAVARLAAGRLLLIGVGGVETGADALVKVRAGATLVQIYTALALGGPTAPARIARELSAALASRGHARLTDAIGADL